MDGDDSEMLVADMPSRISQLGSMEQMAQLRNEVARAEQDYRGMQAEADYLRVELAKWIDAFEREY